MRHSHIDDALRARIVASWPLEGVRAGSALSWLAGRLLVVQDDVPALALIDPTTRAAERVVLEGAGLGMAKADKPDFEASVMAPDGSVYVLGSGSSPKRRRIARFDPASAQVSIVDASQLYQAIAERVGTAPNLEGAVHFGDSVQLLHRGAGDGPSAVVDVRPAALDGRDAHVGAPCAWDLGRIAGVRLAFSDAAPFDGGRLLYLAVAEDTPNAIDDGQVVGSAIGVLDDQRGRWAPVVEIDGATTVRKAEGVALDPDLRGGWLVTDPDDPSRAADLCRIELSGAW